MVGKTKLKLNSTQGEGEVVFEVGANSLEEELELDRACQILNLE